MHNLELKKTNDVKKATMAAQFAAEAILAPLEAELKLARQEVILCPYYRDCISVLSNQSYFL
jgi:hypothetical protein